jgi:CHAD domain-containing protein
MSDHDDRSPLGPALLGTPAQHAVRVIAAALLDDVHAAHARFEEDDADALHDLRVAMRRLRSWLRAFRPELSDTVRGRTRRKLRALASATNDARDDEVTLAFIARQADLPARSRAPVRDIVGRLEKVCDDHSRALRRTLGRELRKTTRDLATELASWWECHRLDDASSVRPMSAVFAEAIRDQARRMDAALARIDGAERADDVHRARIAAKRLRYLLQPLGEEAGVAESVRQLRSLQRQLGDARDAHRIATRLIREIGEHAAREARGRALRTAGLVPGDEAEPPRPLGSRSALTELARRAQLARESAFGEFATHWSEEELAAFAARIDGIAARVAGG